MPGNFNKRKLVPPVYLLIGIALVFVMDRWLPVLEIVPEGGARQLSGVLLAIGIVLIAYPAGQFGKAGTGIVPFDEATALVTGGFYRFTRNPMYLGMVMILIGAGVKSGQLGAFVSVPLFIIVINRNFITDEERYLESVFGQAYADYRNKVRRWL